MEERSEETECVMGVTTLFYVLLIKKKDFCEEKTEDKRNKELF